MNVSRRLNRSLMSSSKRIGESKSSITDRNWKNGLLSKLISPIDLMGRNLWPNNMVHNGSPFAIWAFVEKLHIWQFAKNNYNRKNYTKWTEWWNYLLKMDSALSTMDQWPKLWLAYSTFSFFISCIMSKWRWYYYYELIHCDTQLIYWYHIGII